MGYKDKHFKLERALHNGSEITCYSTLNTLFKNLEKLFYSKWLKSDNYIIIARENKSKQILVKGEEFKSLTLL